MEDLELPPGSPSLQDTQEPEANNDPQDPLNPAIDEEDSARTPPLAHPTADTEAYDDDEAPETTQAMRADEDDADQGTTADLLENDDADEDNESELEELDEAEFDDFDPSALNIPDKPVAVDADNVGLLGVHKRKRTEEEERERKKKRKEKGRERVKKPKRVRAGAADDDDEVDAGLEIEGKRRRKEKAGGGTGDGGRVRQAPRARSPENEEELSPEERRRRALDRKMDEALKSHRPTARRGRAGVDLESMADAEIETMRQKMAKACELDAEARSKGEIATHKLRILPEVVRLMNRNTIQSQLVDPDINILEAVRFMLEPADLDGGLPNWEIQRELFNILIKLNIGKEALIASGIGKVVLFYTRSIQPQADIKRDAERLLWEWMRVVLKKPKNARNKPIQTRNYDPLLAASQARSSQAQGISQAERLRIADEKRRKVLSQPIPGNRARADGSGIGTYSVAPVGSLAGSGSVGGQARTGGGDSFRKMVARSQAKGKR